MDGLSNEAEPMPPSGHPIREVRPTPWVPIQEARTERQHGQSARFHFALDDKLYLSRRVTNFARVCTFTFIKYSYLHGL